MISWHKPGQKVACTVRAWLTQHENGFLSLGAGPKLDEVSTIADVVLIDQFDVIAFALVEYPNCAPFLATDFRPVYPTIIEQLRKLDAPSPQRVKELA